MKSSTGKYYVALDHVRALAAFMVFTWHFIHVTEGQFAGPPAPPLSLLTEGHTGVALFMALSGYLFAKLLDGKRIHYPSFLWNRVLRLVPLLVVIVILVGIQQFFEGKNLFLYARSIVAGVVKPSLPNGGWSITAEFHFYLILPLLLFLGRKSKVSLPLVLLGFIGLRAVLWLVIGQIQGLAYWTIVGRIDQFLLGIMAYQFRGLIRGRHVLALGIFAGFSAFYWFFDRLGGFYLNPSYPSPSPIWIIVPTMEGLAYASLIAWYDNSFRHPTGPLSRFIALIGTYSYSIYLFHFFVVDAISHSISAHVYPITNIYVAMLVSPIGFLFMVPIGYLSYRFIELPFLRFRTKYVIDTPKATKDESAGEPAPST